MPPIFDKRNVPKSKFTLLTLLQIFKKISPIQTRTEWNSFQDREYQTLEKGKNQEKKKWGNGKNRVEEIETESC